MSVVSCLKYEDCWDSCRYSQGFRAKNPIFVMPGLVPGIHVFLVVHAKDVDGRDI
jgi:hypothetical protein